MEAKDQTGISLILVKTDTHTACLSALLLSLAGIDHPRPQSSAGCIQTSCHNRSPLCKSAFLCSFFCYCSHNMVTWDDFRQKFYRDPQLFTHSLIPLACPHIKAVKSVPLGKILAYRSCKLKSNKAVGLKDFVNFGIHLRKVFFIPEDLRCSIRWLKGVSCHLKDCLCADFLVETVADRLRSCVHPDRRIGQYMSVPVNGNG